MLVDTSVWIDHLRRENRELVTALERGGVWSHPFVVGELACGNLKRRFEVLTLLAALPQTPEVGHDEVLAFVERHRLMGVGLGWIDVHLLASAALAALPFWTLDRRLGAAAARLRSKPRQ